MFPGGVGVSVREPGGPRAPAGCGPEPLHERRCRFLKGKQGGRIRFGRETASSASDTSSELPVRHLRRDSGKVDLGYTNPRLWREVGAADRNLEVASGLFIDGIKAL